MCFKHNEFKTFTFSIDQYVNLEIEYNRYIIYKELIKSIEQILIINYTNNKKNNNTCINSINVSNVSDDNIKQKKYENNSIINRFILECINHGISPNISQFGNSIIQPENKYKYKNWFCNTIIQPNVINNATNATNAKNDTNATNSTNDTNATNDTNDKNDKNDTNDINDINDTNDTTDINNINATTDINNINNMENIDRLNIIDDMENINNIEILKYNFLFNKCLNNVKTLHECVYFNKMINEYNEKHIKITPHMRFQLENCIVNSQEKFITTNKILSNKQYIHNANIFNNIECSINIDDNENYIIRYRNYTKTINFNRYSKLINNYDRPYPYDIIKMILRHSIFDASNQHWSIGIKLYEHISIIFNISFEMFASPLNFNMNMYCSLFLDTDKTFGGTGSFYNITYDKLRNQNIKGVFYNPPYLPILMTYTINICLDILYKMEHNNIDFTIISFLPNWHDAIYIQTFLKSKYLVNYKVIKRGDYILHEKDTGKIIRGTFEILFIVLNSKKKSWNLTEHNTFNKNFNNIIQFMKDETII